MDNKDILHSISFTELFIKNLETKLESMMPEVHRQVRVYEERERSGTLTAPPNNNPLFVS